MNESKTDMHDFRNSRPLAKNCRMISTMKKINKIKLMYQKISLRTVPSLGLKASSARITKHRMMVIARMKS